MRRAAERRPGHALILVVLVGCGGAAATVVEEDATGDDVGAPEPPEASSEAEGATGATRPSDDGGDEGGRDNPLDADYADAPTLRTLEGRASYYHDSLAGNSTASGEPYDPTEFTAANRTLPFGTILRVVRRDTGAQVLVRVNDRGPFGRRRRVVDLSRAAAEKLDMIRAGVIDARVEVVHEP